jgi:hypothetical protein
MMPKFKTSETVKNGNGTVTHTWETDPSKPKLAVVGNFYQFNKTLVSSTYVPGDRE